MASEQKTSLFRKKTMDRISSPEDLTDYLRVTNPGIWVVLISVIVLLTGIIVWAAVGTLETRVEADVIVQDNTAYVITDSQDIESGMTFTISSEDYKISDVIEDEYGRLIGVAEVSVPDGTYEAKIVTDRTRPIDFLFKSGGI